MFDVDPAGFLTRPISGTLLACFLLVALSPGARSILRNRRRTTAEQTKEPA